MSKIALFPLMLSVTLLNIGCSHTNNRSSKKASVVTLNEDSKTTAPTVKISHNNEEGYISEKHKANFPPQLIAFMEGALKNNKKILESQHDVLATNEEHNIQKAVFKPVIESVSGISTTPYRYWSDSHPNEVHVNADTTYRTSLRAKWNIYRGRADVAKLESVDKKIEAKWKDHDSLVQDTLLQVVELYFNIVAKQEEIENIKSFIKARKESINVATQMLANGATQEVDVVQAHAAYAEAEAKLSVAEAQLQSDIAKLEEISGVSVVGKLIKPKEIFSFNISESEAVAIAQKYNPKMIATQAEYLAALSKSKEPVDGFYPSIDVESNILAENINGTTGIVKDGVSEHTTTAINRGAPIIGVSATIPIYSGGSGLAKKRQAGEEVTKTRIARERVALEVRTGIKQSLEMIEASNENIASGEKAIKARSLSLQATQEEHQAGVKIMKDVLEEQQKLFEAQKLTVDAIRDKLINQCKLLSLLGRLNPKYLKLSENNFDYNKEFKHQQRSILDRADDWTKRHQKLKNENEYISK